jgi:hemerythrin superfamily protein
MPQTVQQTMTVSDRIRSQHEDIRRLFAETAGGGLAGQTAWPALVRLLAVHETAEEIVVYPAVAASGSRGLRAVRARKAEERRAKITLADLEGLDPTDPAFGPRLEAFRAMVEAHAAAEESEVLPLLDERCSRGQLRAMDRLFVASQFVAPTHAHRFAPVGAVGNLAVGPAVGLIDRVRDALAR